jgi:serine/threonine protein kinase
MKDKLGEGSFGVVYLASRKSKIKTLLPRIAERDIKTLNDKQLFTAGTPAEVKGVPQLLRMYPDEEQKGANGGANYDVAKDFTRFQVEI